MTLPRYPFVGVPTFLRSPLAERVPEDADFAVLGIPIDEGQPFIPGARFGPRAIREHSVRFTTTGDGCFDPRTGEALLERELREGRIVDLGDVEVLVTDVETTFERITAAVGAVLKAGSLPIVLGGDHSISYPVVRAFEGPLCVVQFDAHLDYAAADGRLRNTNTHSFRRIAAQANVRRLVQAGIRGIRTSRAQFEATVNDGNAVISPDELRDGGAEALIAELPEDTPCYVSLDVDALDGALVPGCVSAEPDGLTYPELRDALRVLAERREIVGVDLVELNPVVDVPSGATAYLAANLLVVLLGAIAAQPRWRASTRGRTQATE